jgi:hypothetical protein
VSCSTRSRPALDKTIPVKPPIVNKIKNPNVKINGVLKRRFPAHNVANQLNILIPVGIAIIIVAAVK